MSIDNTRAENQTDAFPLAPPRYFDRGSGAKLLQPHNQAPFVAPGAAYAQADITAIVAALVAAGIMLPS